MCDHELSVAEQIALELRVKELQFVNDILCKAGAEAIRQRDELREACRKMHRHPRMEAAVSERYFSTHEHVIIDKDAYEDVKTLQGIFG